MQGCGSYGEGRSEEEERKKAEPEDSRLHYAIFLETLMPQGSLVPVKGLEPSWGYPRLILSQLRIPFRHTGRQRVSVTEEGRAFIGARQIEAFPVGIGSVMAILRRLECLQEP